MNRLKQLAVLAVMAAIGGCALSPEARTAAQVAAANSIPARCDALVGQTIGVGTVVEADTVREREQLIPFFKRMMLRTFIPNLPEFRAPGDFCRVSAELRPVPGSLIKLQAWLPIAWNGKMYAAGGGGFNGGLFTAALSMHAAASKGYATVVTDVGHEAGNSAKFAHSNHEQFIDFGYRGNHETAVFTKALINTYYGKPAARAYFVGSSNGGREALMEARRFPEDYDGVVAGFPAASWTGLIGAGIWNRQALQGAPKLASKLPAVQDAVLKKCDALDGVTDQVLENPLLCKFDPLELQCKGDDTTSCLNSDEVTALSKVYAGPRLSDGSQVLPGLPVGGENLHHGWDLWLLGEKAVQPSLVGEGLRWMLHGDPKWDWSRADLDSDYRLAKQRMAPITDSDDPDLNGFVARGGKLILHHGWNDAGIPAGSTLNYYAAVRAKLGAATADRHVRLFMVPGMLHGSGGGVPAPTWYDMLDELDRWVEGGAAPERVIASKFEPDGAVIQPPLNAKLIRTRPLCAWPKTAHYQGFGSTDDERSFSCE